MITSIELGDFLAHSETKLEFEKGVTIFVGETVLENQALLMELHFHYLDNIQENQTKD